MTRPWRAADGGLRLSVRLTPRGGRDAVEGVVADADGARLMKVRVASPPVDGAANDALIALLAEVVGARRSEIGIEAGASARVKRVFIRGDAATIAERLETAISRTR